MHQSTSNDDPRALLLAAPMGRLQVAAVGMCFFLFALDGFDVLSISFAAPGIATQWGIDRAALGIVLSMELIGMSIGSVVIGGLADRVGRRPIILGCLAVMTAGMWLASIAPNVVILSAYRLFTGLGIGGILASANAMAAEFSSARRRNLAVIIMGIGYPVGAVIGGSVATLLLAHFDWRSVFLFGCAASALAIPLVVFLLPESIEHLCDRQPANALQRINATLKRMGHATISALPPRAEKRAKRVSTRALLTYPHARTTVLLTIAYFAHIMTFYFPLKWIPKIVVDMGFAPAAAGSVLVWTNVGGMAGALLLGLLNQKFHIKWLVIASLVLAACMVTLFGQGQADLAELSWVAAAAGFFTNSAVGGLFAIFAQSYPAELRAGGTGFIIGFGRGASAIGPVIAGFLFASGAGLPAVAFLMGLGSIVAAVMVFLTRQPQADARESVTMGARA